MKKKFSLLLSMMLLFALLIGGCGKKDPTADELLAGAWGSEGISSIDMNLKMIMDADIDMSSLMSDSSSDSNTTMNMNMNFDLNTKNNGDITYIEGDVNISMFGMSQSENMKSYVTKIDGKDYTITWNEDDSCWYKEESSTSSDMGFDKDTVNSIDSSIFDSYELQEIKKEDTTYTVNGVVSYKNLSNKLNTDLSSLLNSSGSSDTSSLENMVFNTTMVFDRDTQICKSVEFKCDTDSINIDESTKFNELSISIIVNQINNIDVEIPKDVLDSAVDKKDDNSLSDLLNNDDSDIDSENDTSDYSLDDNTQNNELNTEETEETNNLASYLLNVDYIYDEDARDILGDYYNELPEDDVIDSFRMFMNYYDEKQFIEYLDLYEYFDDYEKKALAVMIDIGIFDLNEFSKFSSNINTIELQGMINELAPLRK